MKILIRAELQPVRSGIEARAPEVALTSHGSDEGDAVESLRRGILAWCAGLQAVQKLDSVVKARHLKWEKGDDSVLSVEVNSVWVTPTQIPT